MDPSLILLGIVALLALANVGLSLLPRKTKVGNVVVSFVPPSTIPLSSSENNPQLAAHISSTNQKISLLFSRVEKIEKDVATLLAHTGVDSSEKPSDATWIENVPIRKRRK